MMSAYRVIFVALATAFTIGMTSMASACCTTGWGYSAPVSYAAVAPAAYGGCGGCGAAPVAYAQPVAVAPIAISTVYPTSFGGPCCSWNGCGNCGPTDWNSGCGGGCGGSIGVGIGCGNSCGGGWGGGWNWGRGSGCGNCGGCGGGCGQAAAYAPSSLYVVNQGPTYSGPAATIPYATYSPEAAYAPAADHPYVPGYGYGRPAYPGYYARPYYRQRYAYHAPVYMHPRYYGGGRPRYNGGYRQYP
jgi:hypothetical protein